MSKDMIVDNLYKSKDFNDALVKICPDKRYQEDLKQEFFIILMGKDDIEIQKMFNNKYLMKWSVSVLQNQYHSKTSPFYKKYRRLVESDYDFNQIKVDDEEKIDIDLVSEVEFILDNEIHWFDAHIFKLYYFNTIDKETGDIRKPLSTRKIEELHKFNNLKIDHTSVHKSIKKTLSVVIDKLRKKGLIENGDINRNN